jgi:hypothetical protein
MFRVTAAVSWVDHKKHAKTNSVGRMQSFGKLKQLVYMVTTGLYRVKPQDWKTNKSRNADAKRERNFHLTGR